MMNEKKKVRIVMVGGDQTEGLAHLQEVLEAIRNGDTSFQVMGGDPESPASLEEVSEMIQAILDQGIEKAGGELLTNKDKPIYQMRCFMPDDPKTVTPEMENEISRMLKHNFRVIQANILDFPMDKVSSKMMPLAIESAVDEMHELAAKEMSRGTKAAYRFMRDKSDDMLHDFVRDKMAREAREMVIPDLLSACKNKECDCKKANPLAALSTATELARLYAHFLAQFADYIALLATGELSYAKVYEPAWKTVGFEPLTQSLSLNSSQS